MTSTIACVVLLTVSLGSAAKPLPQRGPLAAVLRGLAMLRNGGSRGLSADFADLVDNQAIGRRVLGVHHAGLTPKQHRLMADAVGDYVSAAYQRHQRELGSFGIDCREHKLSNDFAEIRCLAKQGPTQKQLTILLRRTDRWRAFDVQGPDFSMIRDNTQKADQVIRREGFEGYLNRLRQGIAKLRAQPRVFPPPPNRRAGRPPSGEKRQRR